MSNEAVGELSHRVTKATVFPHGDGAIHRRVFCIPWHEISMEAGIGQRHRFEMENIEFSDLQINENDEFDFYMQFEWPEHIERALRRLLWISLVEAAEFSSEDHSHTSFIRWSIATCPDSPVEVLDYLAVLPDATPELLVRIAENPHTSSSALAFLAEHDSAQVRLAVADNDATSVDVLIQLLEDSDTTVRYSMAENPALPLKMLQQLVEDENPYVGSRASKTIARRNPCTVQQFPQRIKRTEGQRKLG